MIIISCCPLLSYDFVQIHRRVTWSLHGMVKEKKTALETNHQVKLYYLVPWTRIFFLITNDLLLVSESDLLVFWCLVRSSSSSPDKELTTNDLITYRKVFTYIEIHCTNNLAVKYELFIFISFILYQKGLYHIFNLVFDVLNALWKSLYQTSLI